MTAPIIYVKNFLDKQVADDLLEDLWANLPWLHVAGNRREYWANDMGADYTYGEGRGERTYASQPWHKPLLDVRTAVSAIQGEYHGCFVNGYSDEKDALDWHSDDSPSIDASQPIAIISLGAERAIMFRPIDDADPKKIETMILHHGSLCLMLPGMQQTHRHKIPRHSAPCGKRVSLTYRGLLP